MSILSLNVRGLVKVSRARALSNLFKNTRAAIILLQETMCDEILAIHKLCKFLPYWEVAAVSSCGLSGGLAVAWDPNVFAFKVFSTPWGMLLKGSFCGNHHSLSILNCYAPYRERQSFWVSLQGSGLMNLDDLIIAGDLNFNCHASEIWGSSARLDDLADFFAQLIVDSDLVDVQPHKLVPTWTNDRFGCDGVHKRLDRFLVKSDLLGIFQKHRFWVFNYKFSDHWPIILQLDELGHNQDFPFKFNSSWLGDDSFCCMVRDFWLSCDVSDSNPIQNFCHKLKGLKEAVSKWIRDKKKADKMELSLLEKNL